MSAELGFPRSSNILPSETGYNAAATNAAIVGSTIDVSGANTLVLYCNFVRVAATGTISLTVEAYDAIQAAWFFLQTIAISSGAAALSKMSLDKATGSASVAYELRLTNLAFDQIRVSMPAAITAAGATDTLTISGRRFYQVGG